MPVLVPQHRHTTAKQQYGQVLLAGTEQQLQVGMSEWIDGVSLGSLIKAADGLMGNHPLWGQFWRAPQLSHAQAKVLAETQATIHGILTDYGKPEAEFGLIHADLHPYNMLVDRTGICDALMTGYRALRPLRGASLDRLPVFLLIRSLILLGWINDRPELLNEERVHGQIQAVAAEAQAFLQRIG